MILYISWVLVTKIKPEIHSGSVDCLTPSNCRFSKSIFAYTDVPFLERLWYLKCFDTNISVGHLQAWKGFQLLLNKKRMHEESEEEVSKLAVMATINENIIFKLLFIVWRKILFTEELKKDMIWISFLKNTGTD